MNPRTLHRAGRNCDQGQPRQPFSKGAALAYCTLLLFPNVTCLKLGTKLLVLINILNSAVAYMHPVYKFYTLGV